MSHSMPISTMLIGLLVWMNISPDVVHAAVLAQYAEDKFRRQVRAFGAGTEVTLELGSGKKLRGTIGASEDSEFEVIPGKKRPPTWIPYGYLRHLEVIKAVFPDAASRQDSVRNAIVELGVGHRLKLRLASGDKVTGYIRKPQDGGFLLVSDKKGQTENIPYDDVVELWPANAPNSRSGMHPLKKFAIGYAIIMVLIFAGSREPGGLP